MKNCMSLRTQVERSIRILIALSGCLILTTPQARADEEEAIPENISAITEDPPSRAYVPRAIVAVPATAILESSEEQTEEAENTTTATPETEKEKGEARDEFLASMTSQTAVSECRELANITSEGIMEMIVMTETGPDSRFCHLGAGEVCTDFTGLLKDYGNLKASTASGGSYCTLQPKI